MSKKFLVIAIIFLILGISAWGFWHANRTQILQRAESVSLNDGDEEAPVPQGVPVAASDIASQAHDTSALGGYNVLIADRGNNRLIEVTPDKKIVWEYDFDLPRKGLGADDSFFTDGGKSIIVNLEEYHVIEVIDYQTKKVVWSYGHSGVPGKADGYLNTPDDAYKLPNGNVITADIKNCRVIEISPAQQIVRQYGITGRCSNKDGFLNKPNGDTPLPDGHILVSNIVGNNLIELGTDWKPTFTMPLPVIYPSDPQLTKAGNILISDYSIPGKIVEVSKQGDIVWQFDGAAGDVKLRRPSLAIELPNGNILSNDDSNHRVIIIDKQTKKIVWQYGVTGKPGVGAGQLNTPDGVDIIKSDHITHPQAPMTVGQVSRHPANYVNQSVTISGYVLKNYNSYVIVSDESSGTIGLHDLPITGSGIMSLLPKTKYIFTGVLKYQGLSSSNNNNYHLELSSPVSIAGQ